MSKRAAGDPWPAPGFSLHPSLGLGGVSPTQAEHPQHQGMGGMALAWACFTPLGGRASVSPPARHGGDWRRGRPQHALGWQGGEVRFLLPWLIPPCLPPPQVFEQRRWLGSKLLHLTSALVASALPLRLAPAQGFTEPPPIQSAGVPRQWGETPPGTPRAAPGTGVSHAPITAGAGSVFPVPAGGSGAVARREDGMGCSGAAGSLLGSCPQGGGARTGFLGGCLVCQSGYGREDRASATASPHQGGN